jgi:hypothetical protein
VCLLGLYLAVKSAQTRDRRARQRPGRRQQHGAPFLSLLRRLFVELFGIGSSLSDHIVSYVDDSEGGDGEKVKKPEVTCEDKHLRQPTKSTFRELVQSQMDNEEEKEEENVSANDVILRAYDGHYHAMSHIRATYRYQYSLFRQTRSVGHRIP